MRKIEEQMLRAIAKRRNWKKSNTRVNIVNKWAEVFLFGNKIAQIDLDSGVIYATHCGWPTVTTKSRLCALGVQLYQAKKMFYVQDANGVSMPWTTVHRHYSYTLLSFTKNGYFLECEPRWPEMLTEQQIYEIGRQRRIERQKNSPKAIRKRGTRASLRYSAMWGNPNFF